MDAVLTRLGELGPWSYAIERWRFRRDALERARRVFDRHGGKAVFFGRFVAFLRAFAPGTLIALEWRRLARAAA